MPDQLHPHRCDFTVKQPTAGRCEECVKIRSRWVHLAHLPGVRRHALLRRLTDTLLPMSQEGHQGMTARVALNKCFRLQRDCNERTKMGAIHGVPLHFEWTVLLAGGSDESIATPQARLLS